MGLPIWEEGTAPVWKEGLQIIATGQGGLSGFKVAGECRRAACNGGPSLCTSHVSERWEKVLSVGLQDDWLYVIQDIDGRENIRRLFMVCGMSGSCLTR